ncbi:hypothetical protein [Catalinimonas niigatensis]|uniref:hypothetical protein n=1 Tax=Catalinimonas niigatensis TaxID=1397264 RepID=UPI0026650EF0|nr:hypothetical protein [Catalinimonas niigatensis]WPP51530.1 hypothetical protein PZB72_03910 [Catalinimonas niigatensis]
MKKIFPICITLCLTVLLLSACEEESDMAFDRVAAPVVLQYDSIAPNEAQLTLFELDKTGILDQNVGIKYNPISNLAIDVSQAGTMLGTFTTASDGTVVVPFQGALPNEFAGTYDGVAFRIFKTDFD